MPGEHDTGLRFPILIGDIGGTNARFSVVLDAHAEAVEPQIVQTADFATMDEAIRAAVLDRSSVRPASAVLAVARPVGGGEIPLPQCPWGVKPKGMLAGLGLGEVVVLNDFEAQALAVAALGEAHMERIGGGTAEPHAGRVALGPGTGLGVAGLIHALGRWIPVPGEGGHMDIGPRTPRDYQVFPHIETIEGRVSGEQILCGRGLVNVYRAVAKALLDIGAELTDEARAVAVARELDPEKFGHPELKTQRIGEAASVVSAIPKVREALVNFQRQFAADPPGAVLDGRDIGTIICPDADVKIFVVADPQVRARRRTLEARARGENADEAAVLADILKRDERDRNRTVAPLIAAPDAHTLDNSHLDIEAGVRAAIAIVESVRAGR